MKKLTSNFCSLVVLATLLFTFSMSGCVFSPLCPPGGTLFNPIRYETAVYCPDQSKLKTKIFYAPYQGGGRFRITIQATGIVVEPLITLYMDSGNTESSVETVLSKKVLYYIHTFPLDAPLCDEGSGTETQYPLPRPPENVQNPCGGGSVNLNY